METGLVNKWILVHDGYKVLSKQFNDNLTTASSDSIEMFDTEDDLDTRTFQLGLAPYQECLHE